MTTKRSDFLEQITFGLFVIMKKVTFVKWDISVLYYLDSFFVKTENIKHKKIHKTFGFYFYHFEVISLNHTSSAHRYKHKSSMSIS